VTLLSEPHVGRFARGTSSQGSWEKAFHNSAMGKTKNVGSRKIGRRRRGSHEAG